MGERILLLSAGFGSGHLQAARAVADAFGTLAPDAFAEAVDVKTPMLQVVSSGYLALLDRAPGTYRTLYQAPVGGGTRWLIRTALGRAVQREIARLQPTAVVATHPFPGGAAAQLRATGRLSAPVFMVITDFLPHPLHVHAGVDHYFVASHEAVQRLKLLGVLPKRITVTGIPVRSEFGCGRKTRHSAGRRVLVMGGGLGLGPLVEAVRSLALLPQSDLQVTVVCGHNEALLQDLQDLFGLDSRMRILGYTDQIPRLMARADLLVTKPGGITCSEALTCSLPMLLLRPLPGHEEENAQFLAATGAAELACENRIGKAVNRLLFDSGENLARMRDSARLARHRNPALTIANQIFIKQKHRDNWFINSGP